MFQSSNGFERVHRVAERAVSRFIEICCEDILNIKEDERHDEGNHRVTWLIPLLHGTAD